MIRIFIGTDSSIHEKAELALAYSILKESVTEPVAIEFMQPGWKSGCTGFTNHRFLIPSMCDFEGFAIYVDVDMLFLADPAELWAHRKPGKWCTTPMRDDVSVIDCAAFKDLTEDVVRNRRKDAIRAKIGGRFDACIPKEWNMIDKLTPETKLIHYSDLDRQPWNPIPGHPYKPHPDPVAVALFWDYYQAATLPIVTAVQVETK